MDINKLIQWVEPSIVQGFGPPPFHEACAQATFAAAGRSADDHRSFLARWNGCYALGGALHLFGARTDPPNQSLDAWNRNDGWRQCFGPLIDGVTFFAESAFGDQFGYRDGKVVRFKALEARVERIAPDFSGWLEQVFIEPARFVSLDLFHECVQRHGPLPFGGHFGVLPMWVPGRPLRASDTEVLPSRDNMELRAAAAMRISSVSRIAAARR